MPFDVVVRGLRRALMDADARLGVRAQLIMCFLRAEYAMATLLKSLPYEEPYKEWIVGVGLDSDERGDPPAKFAAVHERAESMRAEGIRKLMDLGVRVTVDSDDPAYFSGYVQENLPALQEALQLGREEPAWLERDAFEIAWLPRQVKDAYLAEIDAYVS